MAPPKLEVNQVTTRVDNDGNTLYEASVCAGKYYCFDVSVLFTERLPDAPQKNFS